MWPPNPKELGMAANSQQANLVDFDMIQVTWSFSIHVTMGPFK
jgi:hypothetical protein